MSGNSIESKLRPVAFMVMPFGERTVPSPPEGGPSKIDCDALWDRAFRPALEDLGYTAIRADVEIGSVIVKDMLERLAFAELVVADLTLPNGNVYYEVGMRHVTKMDGCILIAAEGSKRLFDLGQIRTDRYPLKNGSVPDEEAEIIKKVLKDLIPKKKDSLTPYHELVKNIEDSTVFRGQIDKISKFQGEVRVVRRIRDKKNKKLKVQDLCVNFKDAVQNIPEVALELLMLVRDSLGWEELLNYVNSLPDKLQNLPFTKEHVLLAKSNLGEHEEAICGLEELIEEYGDSAERRGLIGGRYKKLWREAREKRSVEEESGFEESGYLDDAIKSYKYGMELDYNEFYCSCNLPGLLQARKNEGDEEESVFVSKLVIKTCERKLKRGEDDGYVKATLLGAAFRSRDVNCVNELAIEVYKQNPAEWKLDSMLGDINDTINHIEDEETREALSKVRDKLAGMSNS